MLDVDARQADWVEMQMTTSFADYSIASPKPDQSLKERFRVCSQKVKERKKTARALQHFDMFYVRDLINKAVISKSCNLLSKALTADDEMRETQRLENIEKEIRCDGFTRFLDSLSVVYSFPIASQDIDLFPCSLVRRYSDPEYPDSDSEDPHPYLMARDGDINKMCGTIKDCYQRYNGMTPLLPSHQHGVVYALQVFCPYVTEMFQCLIADKLQWNKIKPPPFDRWASAKVCYIPKEAIANPDAARFEGQDQSKPEESCEKTMLFPYQTFGAYKMLGYVKVEPKSTK